VHPLPRVCLAATIPIGRPRTRKEWTMIELSDREIAEFWHRSYTSADGLWFLKTEGRYGFDAALALDNEVWEVLPKIQARMLKAIGHLEPGLRGLLEALTTKLKLDGFSYRVDNADNESGFKVTIDKCPWHNLMVKSDRTDLSGKVGDRICGTEYSVWASEFGDNITFERGSQICKGSDACVLRFDLMSPDTAPRSR
jgi:hypothetical protein